MPAILNQPVLQLGSQSAAVSELQFLLKDYAAIAKDGIYGPSTELAVRQFQKRMFMPEDGIVDDRTWISLFKKAPVDMPQLSVGYVGIEVVLMNRRLGLNGFRSILGRGYTGFTQNVVIEFQRAKKLIPDGIVGDRTWLALSKLPQIALEMIE
jgi:peptidoglycan hydrolase-like protein with peptidoglycan-binding domain